MLPSLVRRWLMDAGMRILTTVFFYWPTDVTLFSISNIAKEPNRDQADGLAADVLCQSDYQKLYPSPAANCSADVLAFRAGQRP